MESLAIKVVVTGPKFYWRHENEWRYMSPEFSALCGSKLQEVEGLAKKFEANKADDGLIATLTATVDGKAVPDRVIVGLSHEELGAMQKKWRGWGEELGSKVEKHEKDKDKKRGYKGHGRH